MECPVKCILELMASVAPAVSIQQRRREIKITRLQLKVGLIIHPVKLAVRQISQAFDFTNPES